MNELVSVVNAQFHFWVLIYFFLVGCCIGSFLNVCIFRLPRNQSVVKPRSQCRCGTPIPWFYNIPVLGWILIQGQSKCCNAPVSIQYPIIELITGIIFSTCWQVYPNSQGIVGMIFISFLIVSAVIDFKYKIVPEVLILLGTSAGLLLAMLFPQTSVPTENSYIQIITATWASLYSIIVSSGCVLWFFLIIEYVFKKEFATLETIFYVGFIGAFLGWKGALIVFAWALLTLPIWFLITYLLTKTTVIKQTPSLAVEQPNTTDLQIAQFAIQFSLLPLPLCPALALMSTIYFLNL